jgi:TM2 domain-containing membrane protein YozV
MTSKSPSTTFWLNFFIPGSGHLYASGGERWGLFAINVGCALLGGLLIFPWIGNIVVWVMSMAQSSAITAEYNGRAVEEADLAQRERAAADEQAARKRAEEARVRADEQARAAAREASEREVSDREVRGSVLAQKYARLAVLQNSGVLDQAEADRERKKLVADSVSGGWTNEDVAEFLGPFADLMGQAVCRPEDLQAVKSLYAALKKGRPTA